MNGTQSPLAPLRQCDAPARVKTQLAGLVHRQTVIAGRYKLQQGAPIGEGAHGTVLVGCTKAEGGHTALVAVKRMPMDAKHDTVRHAQREAALQVRCHDHPNIATVFDFVQDQRSVFLVLEHADGGDLFAHVLSERRRAVRLDLFAQVVSAVAHMHAKGVAHRDIKPENVVLANNKQLALLCDFGAAISFNPKANGLLSQKTGTLRCMAPEMFIVSKEQPVALFNPFEADVWALGILLFFMLSGQFPFEGATPQETAERIVHADFSASLPPGTPPQYRDLAAFILRRERAARPTASEVLERASRLL